MSSDVASVARRMLRTDLDVEFPWNKGESTYAHACRLTREDVPQLLELVRRWVDPDWSGDEFEEAVAVGGTDADLLPVMAWRALAELGAPESIGPLVEFARGLGDEDDDWSFEDLPHVLGKLGPGAQKQLLDLAQDLTASACSRSVAVYGLQCMAEYFPETRASNVEILSDLLDEPDEDIHFNTDVMAALWELKAREVAPVIERAFAANQIDIAMCGDWEAVRQELGVESLGLEMPEEPYDSMSNCRFNATELSQRIFAHGDFDEEAADFFIDRIGPAFHASSQGLEVIERCEEFGFYSVFLDFAIHYRGESIEEMSPATMDDILLDVVPRKVSIGADRADALLFELVKFWEYLGSIHKLANAQAIIDYLNRPQVLKEFKECLSDSSNFGMAKSMFVAAAEAGIDVSTEDGMQEFVHLIENTPHSLPTAARVSPSDDVDKTTVRYDSAQVGRNAPCPCGSGKKFKKCCR